MAHRDATLSPDDPRDPPVPVPDVKPVIEEPDETPPPREEPGSDEPAPSEAPMIA